MTEQSIRRLNFSFSGKPSGKLLERLESALSRPGAPTGFLRPPDSKLRTEIQTFVSACRGSVKNYCVVGIGGSALPVRALASFFVPNRPKASFPKIWILDTLDPDTLSGAFSQLLARPEGSLFHVVSKSGRTMEVELIRRHLVSILEKKGGPGWKDRFLATTSPGPGNPLLRWAARNRIRYFPLAADVGGRFSSFSPVTYVAAAFYGVDLAALSLGAEPSAALKAASARYAEELYRVLRSGRRVAAFMTYGDELADLSELLLQLFAESLGKKGKGMTPVRFTGPRDQHSLLQLYLDGPLDKSATVISIAKETQTDIGRAFWASKEGVCASLKQCGVPLWRVELAEKSAESYGSLLQFFHLAVVSLSVLMGINAFDQPMVEMQKKFTKKFLEKN